MSTIPSDAMTQLAAAPLTGDLMQKAQQERQGSSSWFQAVSSAFGRVLDAKAQDLQAKAEAMGNGDNDPSALTNLTAASMEFSFNANGCHAVLTSLNEGVSKMSQKQ